MAGGFPRETNQRKLYDYTNGYDGGSNSSIQTHTKADANKERGFISPEDGRGYYVMGTQSTKTVYTVKGSDGTKKLNHYLSSLDGVITSLKWVYDSDFCVVGAYRTKFAIVNFMDDSKPSPAFYTVPSGERILNLACGGTTRPLPSQLGREI